MDPISPNDHKWEIFLKNFAEDARQATNPDLIQRIIENLTIIDHKCDRIAQVIKRSPACYNDFHSAIRSCAIKECWNEKIPQLITSIEMNFPVRINRICLSPKIELRRCRPIAEEILESIIQLVVNKEFTSETPDYKKIDVLFGQLHTSAWKALQISKDSDEYHDIKILFSNLLDKLDQLFSKHIKLFDSKNGIAFYSVLISRFGIPPKLSPLLGFIKYHSDEIILRELLYLLPTLSMKGLERFDLVIDPLKRDLDSVIALLKVDIKVAESLKVFFIDLYEEYLKLEFTEQHRNVLVKFFDLVFLFHMRVPEIIDERIKGALEDKVTIYFDAGPLCLRKHQVLLLCKSSHMMNELIFGNMRESVEFAESNKLVLKEINRNDFRLMVQRYYSVSEQGELDPKYWIKLAYLGEFLDIKFIREYSNTQLQRFAESLKNGHMASPDCESCAALETLARLLSKLNLTAALDGFLVSLKLSKLWEDKQAFNRVIVECKDLLETEHYFKLYCLHYSLIKKHFPERLKDFHEREAAPLIKSIFNISLSHPEKSYQMLRLVRDALMVQPFEKTVEFTDNEFDDFVVMPTKPVEYLIDLDLSEYPVKLRSLEALKGLFIGTLHLKKGNFSSRELTEVGKLFPGVVVTFKD